MSEIVYHFPFRTTEGIVLFCRQSRSAGDRITFWFDEATCKLCKDKHLESFKSRGWDNLPLDESNSTGRLS